MKLNELSPHALQAAVDQRATLYAPFGTLEWHSDHLPLGLDTLVAQHVCEVLAGEDDVAAPATPWGIGGVPYPGTVRLDAQLLESLYGALLAQFSHLGFRSVVLLPGHYGLEQVLALKRAALLHMRASDAAVLAAPLYEFATDLGYDGVDHAGHWETSLLLWARGDLVNAARLADTALLDGVIGRDPRSASAGEGERLVRAAGAGIQGLMRVLAGGAQARSRYADVLAAQVGLLEHVALLRASLPRARIPPLMTPEYQKALQALTAADLPAAKAAMQTAWMTALDASQGAL